PPTTPGPSGVHGDAPAIALGGRGAMAEERRGIAAHSAEARSKASQRSSVSPAARRREGEKAAARRLSAAGSSASSAGSPMTGAGGGGVTRVERGCEQPESNRTARRMQYGRDIMRAEA